MKHLRVTHGIGPAGGEAVYQPLINFVLRHFSEVDIPVKRGTFIEYRTGMLNFSPVGRACSQQERIQFFEYDKEHKIRETFVAALKQRFPAESYGLQFSIGGQISVDCFPIGWDKTYCLRYFKETDEIHFFGDMTHPGGNDHEIFAHERTVGHTVKDPEDTIRQLSEIFQMH
jgi:phosphomannomutase